MASPLLDALVRDGRITAPDRDRVAALAAERGEGVPVILARLGLVGERALADCLVATLDLRLAEAGELAAAPFYNGIEPGFLQRARILPLAEQGGAVELAMADPTDAYALSAVRLALRRPVRPVVAVGSEIDAALARRQGETPAVPGAAARTDADDRRRLADQASDEPVIRFVNGLFAQAVSARASDIHIETEEGGRAGVRFRVDGVLRPATAPPAALRTTIIGRLKLMAALDIAERRLPQDGRLRTTVEGRDIDVRVSIVPTIGGESAVLRLLDRERAPLDLAALGFSPAIEAGLTALLAAPHGIILATGPTGSGKTSTLYAALQRLHTPERKILTAEDPVEYRVPGIAQVPVRPEIGLGFPALLRSLLRQDPDIMLVGEIRDGETAQIAVQASLTGHLVLSTLHTNDAPGAVTRLIDMGVEDYLVTSVLRGVVAQRLVRRLCPACKRPRAPDPALARRLGLAADGAYHEAGGCDACGGTGYRGRLAVAELLTVDDGVAGALLAAEGDARRLREVALAHGMAPLLHDALAKAAEGTTSLDEALRVAAI